MKNRYTKLGLMVLVAGLILALTGGTVLAKKSKDNVFIIGDSLSDPGNLFDLTGYPPSPYAERFSNGPVWVEYFAADSDVAVDNRAYGGAFTGVYLLGGIPISNLNNVQYPTLFTGLLPGVPEEIDSLLADYPKGLNPKALYVIWVGPNDFFLGLAQPATLPGILTQMAANIAEGVCRLGTAGARHFVVGNLADMGLAPFAREGEPGTQAFISQTIAEYNVALSQVLSDLPSACAETVQIWDTYQALQDIAAAPEMYGLTNTTEACLIGAEPCSNPDEYLFWDSAHPTTAVHEIIADQFASAICGSEEHKHKKSDSHSKAEKHRKNYGKSDSHSKAEKKHKNYLHAKDGRSNVFNCWRED